MGLDHVALTVADHERSATFYAEHFGLTSRVHEDEHSSSSATTPARC